MLLPDVPVVMYAPTAPLNVDQSVIVESLYFYADDDFHTAIILTPACDFEQRKAEMVLACAIISAWDHLRVLAKTDWVKDGLVNDSGVLIRRADLSTGKTKTFKEKVRRLAAQQFPRYHWLAPLPGTTPPLIADFQLLSCLTADEVQSAKPIAGLLSPFREQLPARYSAYMGRVGTPDFEESVASGWLDAAVEELFPSGNP